MSECRPVDPKELITPDEYLEWFKKIRAGQKVALLYGSDRLDEEPTKILTVKEDEGYEDFFYVEYNDLKWTFSKSENVKEHYKESLEGHTGWPHYNTGGDRIIDCISEFLIAPPWGFRKESNIKYVDRMLSTIRRRLESKGLALVFYSKSGTAIQASVGNPPPLKIITDEDDWD